MKYKIVNVEEKYGKQTSIDTRNTCALLSMLPPSVVSHLNQKIQNKTIKEVAGENGISERSAVRFRKDVRTFTEENC